jgi:hypothetical protein
VQLQVPSTTRGLPKLHRLRRAHPDENGTVQAALVKLSQPLYDPREETLKNLSMHSFALTNSMAIAIENRTQAQ